MNALIINGEVSKFPYSIDEFKIDNKHISFPSEITDEILSNFGVEKVIEIIPVYDESIQVAELSGCKLNTATGKYEQVWSIREMTNDEKDSFNLSLLNNITSMTQKRLDSFARTRNYDSILSACTYAASLIPKFKSEGQYCVQVRDATWNKLYEIFGQVKSGERKTPTSFSDIEQELPVLVWPE